MGVAKRFAMFGSIFLIKDTDREKALSKKTQSLPKSLNTLFIYENNFIRKKALFWQKEFKSLESSR